MPKLRGDDVEDIDVKALDEAEYNDDDFAGYEGEIPPDGTVLSGYISKLWWTRTQEKADGTGDNPMLKILWVAGDNEGDLDEFNGLPVWENAVLIPSAKFRWAPFLENFGITLKSIKTQTYVANDEDQFGSPVEKIGAFVPGEESDDAWSRIIIKRGRWDGVWRAEVRSWLPFDADAADADPGDDDEPDEADDLDEDDLDDEADEVDETEDEPEETPPPVRGRRAARTTQAASKAPPARAGRTAKAATGKAAGATTASRNGRAAKSTATAAAPARGKGRSRTAVAIADDDEPPF
jgi:hypothetical protein